MLIDRGGIYSIRVQFIPTISPLGSLTSVKCPVSLVNIPQGFVSFHISTSLIILKKKNQHWEMLGNSYSKLGSNPMLTTEVLLIKTFMISKYSSFKKSCEATSITFVCYTVDCAGFRNSHIMREIFQITFFFLCVQLRNNDFV